MMWNRFVNWLLGYGKVRPLFPEIDAMRGYDPEWWDEWHRAPPVDALRAFGEKHDPQWWGEYHSAPIADAFRALMKRNPGIRAAH
jgi:hypothetical protein